MLLFRSYLYRVDLLNYDTSLLQNIPDKIEDTLKLKVSEYKSSTPGSFSRPITIGMYSFNEKLPDPFGCLGKEFFYEWFLREKKSPETWGLDGKWANTPRLNKFRNFFSKMGLISLEDYPSHRKLGRPAYGEPRIHFGTTVSSGTLKKMKALKEFPDEPLGRVLDRVFQEYKPVK